MKLNFDTYKDKVRACWIGKNIGGTMGGPFECAKEILNVTGFTSAPGEPLPNDDLDLQLVWLHALETVGPRGINASTLGEFWLNFIPPHWNEYGIGKANMKRGLIPPLAGDYDNTWSHSNGAWIRTEIWACAAPALPELAAKYAIEDAKVDHGCGEGTPAAAFVAAMQSAAFALKTLEECIAVGLAAIPENSRVARSIRLAQQYYAEGRSWQDARNAVQQQNADIGNGWFEAPSNVAYTIIGLLWGEGDFKKSMLIAINCGDDTDCTAATAGATMGILYGTAGIPADWAEYIGDRIITISLTHGGVGKGFPASCTELTDRVTDLAPSVLYSYRVVHGHRGKHWYEVFLGSEEDIPASVGEEMRRKVSEFISEPLAALKPYTMHFEEQMLFADVVLSTPAVQPGGDVQVQVNLGADDCFEHQPYTATLRWILPEGFTVSGPKNAFISRRDRHTFNVTPLSYTITAGENVCAENRAVLEVTLHGRHTAMYVSFVLLG